MTPADAVMRWHLPAVTGRVGALLMVTACYGDAHAERPLPTDEEVLEDFEDFWESCAQLGYQGAVLQVELAMFEEAP